ncbi:hypothetical protein Dimus_020568 [Dionaea muscipula]
MWPPWGKSSPRKLRSSSPSISNSNFRCSSFKDIQFLCSPEDPVDSTPRSSTVFHRSPSSTPRSSTVFHRVRTATSILRQWPGRTTSSGSPTRTSSSPKPPISQSLSGDDRAITRPVRLEADPSVSCLSNPGSDSAIVVYTTSLRVVRPTFEACRAVQSILSGFRVSIDERDVSMDPRFMEELQSILGGGGGGKQKFNLPRVFIGGRYVGGAEELKHLHEIGELKGLVEGLPPAEAGVCEACGGFRFFLCDTCSGSHKIYSGKAGFKSCTACNHNGLIRCPSCCPPPLPTVRLELE